ncbi:response regulator [Mesorhizobium sp. B2-3-4]|uniref:response regulator n=1 Tax=Mesorhizobium sp. B2-3-4 TaxID=2589959 RepID=UPI00112E050C|nr:response regulator [Mesorhizobium sp. B2-3-4]TPM29986.1 response regulator [Mesorhizobium sp. B2-3-4]
MAAALRILIVEDEWLIAADHAEHLRRAGCEVVGPVPSVEAALDSIAREQPDSALLDVQLNDETSYVLADTLREKGIPFAFVTGYGDSSLPPRFAKVAVLQKPTNQALLAAVVLKLVQQVSTPKGR